MPFSGFPISSAFMSLNYLKGPSQPPSSSVSLPQIDAAWLQVLSVAVRVREVSEGRSLHLKLVYCGSKVMH